MLIHIWKFKSPKYGIGIYPKQIILFLGKLNIGVSRTNGVYTEKEGGMWLRFCKYHCVRHIHAGKFAISMSYLYPFVHFKAT